MLTGSAARRRAAALLCGVFLGGGVSSDPPPAFAEGETMPRPAATLVGSWSKVESPPCAHLYPAELRLESNGLYRGQADPPGQFTLWDVGTWQLAEPGRLALSTANDAVITYAFTLAADRLTFTDPQGCRFSYRRTG